MAPTTQHPVVLFDGVCNLCNASVQWLIDRDREGVLRYATLQSDAARELLAERLSDEEIEALPDAIVFVDEDGVHAGSTAALRIAGKLGWPWKAARYLLAVPRFVRDPTYDLVARNRYSWFGRRETCMVPTPELAERFLDAGELSLTAEPRIRRCTTSDVEAIHEIVNEAARAYRSVIAPDCWKDPYMPREELEEEIAHGVTFWGYERDGQLLGIMGLQRVGDVWLIRHAYVRSAHQGEGIGGSLLRRLGDEAAPPIMVGTWAAATWAIRFYESHGFVQVSPSEKDELLRRYWEVSERQIEESVVLVLSVPE